VALRAEFNLTISLQFDRIDDTAARRFFSRLLDVLATRAMASLARDSQN
jgi:hypothetical protein